MRTDVRFPTNGLVGATAPPSSLMLAGHLYLPEDREGGRLPAVVVGHPYTGVKEQTSAIYARHLVEHGFAALTFDAAYQGQSEGEPRGLENPFQRADDVQAAVSFLSTLDDIDPDRIGALGICASGGYVPFAAQTDNRIKAVATVSAVDVGSYIRDGLGKTDDGSTFRNMLDQVGQLRTEEAFGHPARLASALPDKVDDSTPRFYRDGFDYYRTPRGQHRRSDNMWVLRSVEHMAHYASYAKIQWLFPRPLLMIAGTEADTAYFSQEAIDKAADPKELHWIEGAGHFELYDIDEYVKLAVAKIVPFFDEVLR
jgi:uncharacterized protein